MALLEDKTTVAMDSRVELKVQYEKIGLVLAVSVIFLFHKCSFLNELR